MIKTKFESMGVYTPENKLSTTELVDGMKTPPQFDLEAITGIKTRLWRAEDEDSYTMAIDAAESCLKNSKYNAEDLDIIISGSIGRFIGENNYYEPAMSLFIKQKLGADKAIFFDVSNACAGIFTGLYILDSMIKAGIVKNGMVVSGESITSVAETAVLEVKDIQDSQFGSLTVGDSGAAVILDEAMDNEDVIETFEMLSTSEYSDLAIGMPSNESNSYAMYASNSKMHTAERLKIWPNFQLDMFEKLGKNFKEEKFDFIIHHQVGLKFIDKLLSIGTEAFEADMPESLQILDKYGNTSSTSHFLVLYENLKNNKIEKGSKILFVPAGSGFVTGFLSMKVSNLKVA
jgi:3-oxoacyl-[acyl-carrier-protein] synthase III